MYNIKGRGVLYIKSYREGGRTSPTLSQVHISPVSSPHKSNFKSTSPSLRGEVDLKLDLYGLELKLHEVHLAVKFSEAELARLRRTSTAKCTRSCNNSLNVSNIYTERAWLSMYTS